MQIIWTNVLISCILWQWLELLQKKSEKQGSEKSIHVGALGETLNLTSHKHKTLGQSMCGSSLWRLSWSLLYWQEIQLEV